MSSAHFGSSRLSEAFGVNYRKPLCQMPTPPYISNVPDVVARDLRSGPNEKLKFVILATDGCEFGVSRSRAVAIRIS
jgi:hypothetical protein